MNPCPFWNLQSGSIAVAVVGLVSSFVLIGVFGWQTALISTCEDSVIPGSEARDNCLAMPGECPCNHSQDPYKLLRALYALYITQICTLVFLVALLFSCFSLLYGISQGTRYWFWPYFPNCILTSICLFIYSVIWWANKVHGYWIALTAISTVTAVVNLYCFVCVWSLYKELRQKPRLYYYEKVPGHGPHNQKPIVYYEEEKRKQKIYHTPPSQGRMYFEEGRHAGGSEVASVIQFETRGDRELKMYEANHDRNGPGDDSGFQSMTPKSHKSERPMGSEKGTELDGLTEFDSEPCRRNSGEDSVSLDTTKSNSTVPEKPPRSGVPQPGTRSLDSKLDLTAEDFKNMINSSASTQTSPTIDSNDKTPLIASSEKAEDSPEQAKKSTLQGRQRNSSESESDGGENERKRERRDRGRYRKKNERSLKDHRSRSEPEIAGGRQRSKSPHHRRYENRHKRSEHFDSDTEECKTRRHRRRRGHDHGENHRSRSQDPKYHHRSNDNRYDDSEDDERENRYRDRRNRSGNAKRPDEFDKELQSAVRNRRDQQAEGRNRNIDLDSLTDSPKSRREQPGKAKGQKDLLTGSPQASRRNEIAAMENSSLTRPKLPDVLVFPHKVVVPPGTKKMELTSEINITIPASSYAGTKHISGSVYV